MPKGKNKTRTNKKFKGVYIRKAKTGETRFYISFYDPNGRRVRMCVRNAQSWEQAVLARNREIQRAYDIEYGIKRKNEKIKFKDFTPMYIEDYAKANKRSWRTDEYYLKEMIEFFKDYYLSEITGQDVERYKKKRLTDGVKQSTVNRCLAILRKLLNLAREWGYLPEEWKIKIKFYSEKDNARDRVLSEDEEKRLFDASCDHLRSILIIALNTGMRRGEILNLKWSHIDLEAKRIRVEKTKSGKIKKVPINSPLLSELIRLKSKKSQNGFVFSNPKTGKPFTTIKTAFNAACKRAQLTNLRFHDMRGTVATRLEEKGVSSKTISKILGHSSPLITNRHYIRPTEAREIKAVELLAKESVDRDENQEDLSPLCHTKQIKKKETLSIPLFSPN